MSSSLKTSRLIFIWPPGSLWHWLWCECQEPPDLSDCDDTNEDVDTELLSFLNQWSSEGEGVGGCATHGSHHHWSHFQPCCRTWPQSWCDGQSVCPGSSMHSSTLWNISSCGDLSLLQNQQMRMGTSRSSCFDALFCNGLSYQSQAFPQA